MKRFILLVVPVFIWSSVFAQDLTEKFQAKQFVSKSGDTLNYRIFIPEQPNYTDTLPLVLFLHGAGERGSDNKAQLTHGVWRFAEDSVQKKHPSVILAPQIGKNAYWGEPNWRTQSLRLPPEPGRVLALVMELIEQLQHTLRIDSSRLYITGLSMGGFGTWNLITRYPNKFAAAVPVCGGGDVTKARRLVGLPIWNFHGAKDTVVPPELSHRMIAAIREAGGTPGYTEYPDVGHGSWVYAYRDPFLTNWLFSQKKDTN